MILAAGLGTRLRPLTETKPKALMPVANKPILARNIEYLISHGITEIIVNAHHHYQQIVNYLGAQSSFGLNIEVKVEPEILGTGGGIKNTEDFWDKEPFFVINSDILTDINLVAVYPVHQTSGALVTLVLHDCAPFNQIQIDDQWNIMDIAKDNRLGRLAFTGMTEGVFSCHSLLVTCHSLLWFVIHQLSGIRSDEFQKLILLFLWHRSEGAGEVHVLFQLVNIVAADYRGRHRLG